MQEAVSLQAEYFACTGAGQDDACCHGVASSLALSYRPVTYLSLTQALMALCGAVYLTYRLVRRSRLFGHAALRLRNSKLSNNNHGIDEQSSPLVRSRVGGALSDESALSNDGSASSLRSSSVRATAAASGTKRLPLLHRVYLGFGIVVLLLQFALVWFPSSVFSFAMSAVVFLCHAFLDTFVILLALFRIRTRQNVRNAGIIAGLIAVIVSALWVARIAQAADNEPFCSYKCDTCAQYLPQQCTYYVEWGIFCVVAVVTLLSWMRPSGFAMRRVVVPWLVFLTLSRLVIAVGSTLVSFAIYSGLCVEAGGTLIYSLFWAPLLYRTLRSDATFDAFVNAAAYQSGQLDVPKPTNGGGGASARGTDSPSHVSHSSYRSLGAAAKKGVPAAGDADVPPVGGVAGSPAAAAAAASAEANRGLMQRFQPLVSDHSLRVIELQQLELGKLIGSGGFGEVYKGKLDGQAVAIKKLMASSRGDALHEFVKEVDVLGKLHHRNVIQLLGVVIGKDAQYLVLEFAALGSVFDFIHKRDAQGRRRALNWSLAWRISLDAARGMSYLHSFDPPLLHRDLKSQNLLLTDKYRTKLCDFGLSRVKSMTKTMSRIGTVQWVAPEVLREERYCVPARDHQLLTNRGFMFLADVLAFVDCERGVDGAALADGSVVRVRDWRGLRFASYDAASRQLVYEQPAALVCNAPEREPALAEFACADGAVSVVATLNHNMYVRASGDAAVPFSKQTAAHVLATTGPLHLLAHAAAGAREPQASASKRARLETAPALLELYGFWLATAGDSERAFLRQRQSGLAALDERELRAHFGSPHAVAPWVWQLSRDELRGVVRGFAAGSDVAGQPQTLRAASAALRDELTRVLLHAGYATDFVADKSGAWLVSYGDDAERAQPSLDVAARVSGAALDAYRGDATWCATMPSGFVVTRRAHVDAASGDVVRASRPTIQGNSEQADVWSFGVILWELAARKVPFKGIPAIRIATNVAFKNWKLHIPATAPATMAAAMRGCWRRATLRPSFATLAHELALLKPDWTPRDAGEPPARDDDDDFEGVENVDRRSISLPSDGDSASIDDVDGGNEDDADDADDDESGMPAGAAAAAAAAPPAAPTAAAAAAAAEQAPLIDLGIDVAAPAATTAANDGVDLLA